MMILGFNGSLNSIDDNKFLVNKGEFHDAGATLLSNGRIVACYEEERLNRIKHTNKFPVMSILKCLETAGTDWEEVDYFALPTSEEIMDQGLFFYYKRGLLSKSLSAREFIVQKFKDEFGITIAEQKFLFFNHHHAHAATAYYQSGYDNALVVTLDGEGDELSAAVYDAEGVTLTNLEKIPAQNSLGKMYLAVTEYLGYKLFDEYKVMGLASYGDHQIYAQDFEKAYHLLDDGKYRLDLKALESILKSIAPKNEGRHFSQVHKDLAAAAQYSLEQIVIHMLTHYKAKTGKQNLCLAGGVALNCSMNKVLLYKGLFSNIYVSPVSSDTGLPLGAALLGYRQKAARPVFSKLETIYLGTNNPKTVVEAALKNWEELISHKQEEDITERAAQLLYEGKAIGWFQGAAEFGPRALGNRSIIADPRPVENRNRINQIIKMRETYRPFAPSVIEEAVDDYFVTSDSCNAAFSYMTFTLGVKEEYQSVLGAINHIDGTARVQTVNQNQNEKYWKLIKRFGELSGVSVVLNTSFNNNFEPIVDSPQDAIICFLTSDLDYLVIDDYLISKELNPADMEFLNSMKISLPEFINLNQSNGKGHYLSNTFNDWETSISEDISELLIAKAENTNGSAKNGQSLSPVLKSNLYELWQKRLIKLTSKSTDH